VTDYPLRIFGSNVYDFSAVMQPGQPEEAKQTIFMVSGRVFRAGVGWAEIIRRKPDAPVHMNEEWRRNFLLAGPAEQLRRLYAHQVIERMQKGKVSAGELNALDPEMKQLVYEGSHQLETDLDRDYARVFVTNCPAAYCVREKQVRFCAMPVGGGLTTDSSPRYDYGRPFVGDPRGLTNVFLVTNRGIVRKQTPEETAAKKAQMKGGLLQWHCQQASNGVARSQFEIGLRYLRGDEVETNRPLGMYWIWKASYQDYPQAVEFVRTNSAERKGGATNTLHQ
jgi:hypothetical protein